MMSSKLHFLHDNKRILVIQSLQVHQLFRMICAGFHLTGSDDPERCATLGFGDSGGPLGSNPTHV